MEKMTDDPALALRDALVSGGLAIADVSVREAWLRDRLSSVALPLAAAALDQLCLDAEQAHEGPREVLISVVQVLADPSADELSQHLREEAAGASLVALSRLLRRPVTRPREGRREERIPDYGTGRPLTLGERKALARRPDRASFDKLLRDPHPAVIQNLLANPKLTEDDAIALACRRPAEPQIIAAIARSSKWSVRPRVRMSIVLNPGSPPEIAVPLVALLVRPELRLVVELTDAHPAVRAAARELLLRRPPTLGHGGADDDDVEAN